METKSTIVPQTNVDCRTPNKNEIRPTGKADFEKKTFHVWATSAHTGETPDDSIHVFP
jgi:hypothetical protein